MELPELEPHESIGVGEAISHGVTQRSLRRRSLHRPFWGVRSAEPPADPLALVRMYEPRLRSGQVLAEMAAARLHGLPLPVGAPRGVQIVVPTGAYRPSARGVTGRSLAEWRVKAMRVDGLPTLDPVTTWLTLGRTLDVPSLVMVGDALVTAADNYPGLRHERPAATVDDLHRGVAGWGGMAGIARLRIAAPLVRVGVESPMETLTRLVIVDEGLPEPAINVEVHHAGVFVARPDLSYPDARVGIQYDGDGHRSDRSQWQADVARDERLRFAGWQVLHVTYETLEQPRQFLASLRSALGARLS